MNRIRRAPDALTQGDAALRLQYLDEVLALLWPAPAESATGRALRAPATSEFVVVPGLGRPRVLVPRAPARAAATAVRRYSEPTSRLARYRSEALGLAMRTGLGPALMRDRVRIHASGDVDTIETHLAEALGQRVVVSLNLGPARANRKPVLQALSEDGDLLGFVKVGVNDLTRRLVAAEATSLRLLAGADLRQVQVPAALHAGPWRSLEVLVQSPLPVWEKRVPQDGERLADAMLEVARIGGTSGQELVTSAFWAELGAALADLRDDPTTDQLRSSFAAVTSRARGTVVPMGSWHGDWTPWNCAPVAGRLLVWDWERFEHGVPMGFDALHYDLQQAVVGRDADARAAVAGCLGRAAGLLAPFGVHEDDAQVVALAYLMALATRYLQDGQAEAGARLGVLGQWLLPELVERVAAL